jgi:hypothetical protein
VNVPRIATVAALAATFALSAPAWGQDTQPPASPGADQIQFAAHEHDVGYRAYLAKQYDEAATHFENAFFAAPNPAELRNAIRARREAGEPARAATLAAIGQRKFPADAVTAKLAGDVIAEVRPSVFEVRIVSGEDCSVAVDEKIVAVEKVKTFRFFVAPGKHELLVSWSDDRTRSVPIEAKEGASQTLQLDPPSATPPVPVPASVPPAADNNIAPPPVPPPGPPAPEQKPLSPAIFIGAASLTAIAAGVTIWSGIDTLNNPGQDAVKRDCGTLRESCREFQQGVDEQRRTNILLGVTGGVALATAVIGVFFTDWPRADHGPAMGGTGAKKPSGLQIRPTLTLGAFSQAGLQGKF